MEEQLKHDKSLPHNAEAEQAILGAIIIDGKQLSEVIDIIKPEHFYQEGHSLIYETILEVTSKGETVDMVILVEQLDAKGYLERVGGADYIKTLVEQVPSAEHAPQYSKIVKEKYLQREIVKAANSILEMGNRCDENMADSILNNTSTIEKMICELARSTSNEIISLKDAVKQTFSILDKSYRHEQKGLSSGLKNIDIITDGFMPSDLIILASRPGMGKTSLALNICEHIAVNLQKSIGIYCPDMTLEQLTTRMVLMQSEVNSVSLRKGLVTEEEWGRIFDAMDKLARAPLYILKVPPIPVMELCAKVRRMKSEHGIEFFVIDYFQLLYTEEDSGKWKQEMSFISRQLKHLAVDLDIPILCLSKHGRSDEHHKDKIPMVADLQESFAIEEFADVVMFLHRLRGEQEGRENHEPESERVKRMKLIITKNNNGPTGTAQLAFNHKTGKFTDAEAENAQESK
ncbi:MAG: replicative DNA helicase [bacterium]